MRIIGGFHRSRKILAPEETGVTRPITDRVKQSLFDRLTSMGKLDAGAALDVFSGTGSMGLEALSRGMDFCTFVERDRSARDLLAQNLETLKLTESAAVLSVNALSPTWLATVPRQPVDVIFCDPPYAMTAEAESAARVADLISALASIASPGGVLMLRTDGQTSAATVENWLPPESHAYGSMVLHFYHRPEAGESPQP